MHLSSLLFLCATTLFLGSGCARTQQKPPLVTVSQLDLERYMGKWYEIARLPHPFQKGCEATQAMYSVRADGQIDVTNSCHKNAVNGPVSSVRGRARRPSSALPGQLEVSFFRPFWSAYYVLSLAPDYGYAVVGHPSRKYAWILCRDRHMTPATLAPLVALLNADGFDTTKLIFTTQPD